MMKPIQITGFRYKVKKPYQFDIWKMSEIKLRWQFFEYFCQKKVHDPNLFFGSNISDQKKNVVFLYVFFIFSPSCETL